MNILLIKASNVFHLMTAVGMLSHWRLQEQLNGRGDCCCNHSCHVSNAPTTIYAAAVWTPWLKYRKLEGLF
jgi:hypothetical protein